MKQKEMKERQAAAPAERRDAVQDQSAEEIISTLGANH